MSWELNDLKHFGIAELLFVPTLSSLENRNIQGRNIFSEQMFLNTENSGFAITSYGKKKCRVSFWFFLFAFWKSIYYHIQLSVTVPTYFLNALFEDVCTLSKKPAGMPQIVSVLFMTAK